MNFDEQTHTYTDDSGKVLISVTQLLRVAGIAPDYNGVRGEVLTKAAERGTLIHKELDTFNMTTIKGFTTELEEYIAYIEKNGLTPYYSEKMVAYNGIAGTIDCVLKTKEGKYILVDFKTTSSIHKESVSWQESIYKYLLEKTDNIVIDELQVFHFNKDGSLEVKSVLMKPTQKVEDLIDWYNSGTGEVESGLDANELANLYDAENIIKHFEEEKKKAEENAKAIREKIIQAMKDNGLSTFSNDRITISIISASTRKSLDTAKLKAEQPEIYNQYLKETETKESVRITLKEKNNE